MKHRKICSVLVMMAVFVGGLFVCNSAMAKTRIKLAGIFPDEFFVTKSLYRIADKVKEQTNGEVVIKVFPMNQLGGYEEIFEEVQRGTIEMVGTYLTGRFDKRLEMSSIPALATNYEELYRIINHPDSPYHQLMVKILDEMGTKHLGALHEGFMVPIFVKDKLPTNLTDFDNKKTTIRVPALSVYRDTYVALGYQTATIPYTEVFTALQTGVADGNSGSSAEVDYQLFRDVTAYLVPNNLFFSCNDIIINKEVWNKLTKEQQEILQAAVDAEAQWTIKTAEESYGKYKALFQEYGTQVVAISDAEKVAMAQRVQQEVWPTLYEVFGKEFFTSMQQFMRQ